MGMQVGEQRYGYGSEVWIREWEYQRYGYGSTRGMGVGVTDSWVWE